jgi:hypothetical protein
MARQVLRRRWERKRMGHTDLHEISNHIKDAFKL